MSKLRRVGGEMVPHRKPAGRRVLLQYEADLCNAIGLTEDEYWYFVDKAAAYNGQRAKEYELVPDVTNDATTLFVVNLVVGIALTYIGTLLAPKPKAPPEQKRLETADATGRTRFAKQSSFSSVQELATIGSTIPLVFTNDGVRVSSQLLWSELNSRKNFQELRAVLLFSFGELAQKPDFEGFAIGDTLLNNYPGHKLALYFSNGGPGSNRILENAGQKYSRSTMLHLPSMHPNDVMMVRDHKEQKFEKYSSGTRTPATQTEFGVFSPIPNGSAFQPNWELILIQKSLEGKAEDTAREKQRKVVRSFPSRAAITASTGNTIFYAIDGSQESDNEFPLNKTTDVRQAVERRRIDADEILAVGEHYLIDGALYTCTSQDTDDVWMPINATQKGYNFSLSEELLPNTKQPNFQDNGRILFTQEPSNAVIPMRIAIGAVTNNRECIATEIGIKSTVWRRINGFQNVNTKPDDDVIREFQDDNGSIQLGTMNKYVRRMSFFKLFARKAGENNWTDITYNRQNQSTFFMVEGQSPREIYNSITVYTPSTGIYEYRLVPFGGNFVLRTIGRNVPVVHLVGWQGTNNDLYNGSRLSYQYFCYGKQKTLTEIDTNNKEWFFGEPPNITGGTITYINLKNIPVPQFMQYEPHPLPTRYDVDLDGRRPQYSDVYIIDYRGDHHPIWDGQNKNNFPDTNVRYIQGILMDSRAGNKYYQIAKQRLLLLPETPAFDGNITVPQQPAGSGGTGLVINVQWYASNNAVVASIVNGGTGYQADQYLQFNIPGKTTPVELHVGQTGGIPVTVEVNLNKNNVTADYFRFDAESSSHGDGPEHNITYVNEYQKGEAPYRDLAVAGIRINSSKEWANFSDISAYIKKGIKIPSLTSNGVGAEQASNNFAEIAYALLTNKKFGAGDTIGSDQVDATEMGVAADFCRANGFAWDGVVAEKQNLREFIFQNAGYNFLDFTIKGGRFSLFPSVPYRNNFTIDPAAKPSIKALFTDGNMRNMQVSFLSPEERQLFKATVLYRRDVPNGFPEVQTFSLACADPEYSIEDYEKLPEEVFDMSGFCKSPEHARNFAKYALLVRKYVDHGIRFETTPQAAMALQPGEYFRVVSEASHTSRFQTGSVTENGDIVSKDGLTDGSKTLYHWQPGTERVLETTVTVSNNKIVGGALNGHVFSVKNTTTEKRVYKVETLQYADDGLVEISGSYVPLKDDGTLQVLEWNEGSFVPL